MQVAPEAKQITSLVRVGGKMEIGEEQPFRTQYGAFARHAYGSRDMLWNMDLLYQEIDELSQIFDLADRGQQLIADFKASCRMPGR